MACLDWANEEVARGKDCKLKIFRILVFTHRTDDLLPNEVAPGDMAAAEPESSVRWTIEQFHRERKQLTGVQACQCRLARSQRNHIALAVRVWTRLKQAAYQTQQTVCQLKQGFLDAYVRHKLIQAIPSFCVSPRFKSREREFRGSRLAGIRILAT